MDVEEEKAKKPEEEQHPSKKRRGRRRLINLKKLYSYVKHEKHDLVGSEGYSRVVICNSPLDAEQPKYKSNYVSTTKYNAITFIPKGLFEQFRRVSNIYFLVAAALSLTSISPFSPLSLIAPLIFVVGVSMGKESIEDWRRFRQDQGVNNRLVKVHTGDGTFTNRKWKELRVGDVVQVVKDNFFPADLLMLSSNYDDGSCYVETMNLDGETNLKLKKALDITSDLDEEIKFQSFKAVVKCEDPNPNLYSFIGNSEFADEVYPLGPQQILLRDSKLRNTDHIYGVVIFTGYDTKVMQNARGPPSKRSGIERKMDLIIYFLLCMLFIISAIGSVVFGVRTANEMPKWWYLRPDNTISSYDPERPVISALLHLITAMMLYGYLIPISLYVSIEIVKVLQVMFINMDIQIYHKDTDRPTQARTSNLNEELGQVDTILSDKTGTLTCNMMEFLKCSVSGTSYGFGVTEVERAAAKRFGKSVAELEDNTSMYDEAGDDDEKSSDPTPPSVKGFNFRDKRLMNGHWAKEKHADSIQMFFRILSVCHTAIPQEDSETGTVSYEVESPDEGALVVAAQQFGFEFYKRTQNSVSVREHNPQSNTTEEREYQILEVLEFSSARKRMSVIIRSATDGQIFLFCKGSDSVVIERLSADGREWEGPTQQHINKYADSGLRTLAFAYRKLSEDEYKSWSEEYSRAKTHVGADHDAKLDEASDLIEKELILAGATAVEDKLQKGVPECIDRLAQAGIKIWVLTGDKMETAINIGFACSLLRQGMIQLVITLENEAAKIAEASGDKDQIKKVSREMIKQQIREGMEQVEKSEGSEAVFALIIDGKSLNFALEKDMKDNLLQLAIGCASVICCRVSPKQKAQITRLVKEGTRKTTLAIGDGANDVGMIQEADIGVGISGLEGMQAVMASDFAIAQFQFLERLLLVHGNWCYKRITLMICYFFYKNITFGLTLFYYEAYTVFSAQTAYNDWYLALFNVFFTSLPVIALGVLEQDLSAGVKIQFPGLYQEGVQNMLFGWDRILGWMGNGVSSSLIIFFLVINILRIQAFNQGGHESGYAEMGTTMYTCLIWVVNCQIALAMKYFTWINHVLIWGSILVWYIFLIAYGAIPPSISTTAFQIFVEACAPAPLYWLTAPVVVLATLFPYIFLTTLQHWISPMDYHIVLEMVHFNKLLNGNNNSVKRATIGFTAGVDAKIKHWRERLHHCKQRQHNGAQH